MWVCGVIAGIYLGKTRAHLTCCLTISARSRLCSSPASLCILLPAVADRCPSSGLCLDQKPQCHSVPPQVYPSRNSPPTMVSQDEIHEQAKEIVKGLISADLKFTNYHKQDGKAKEILENALSDVDDIIAGIVSKSADKSDTADVLAIRAISLAAIGTRG
jgi:hypothetical protein